MKEALKQAEKEYNLPINPKELSEAPEFSVISYVPIEAKMRYEKYYNKLDQA